MKIFQKDQNVIKYICELIILLILIIIMTIAFILINAKTYTTEYSVLNNNGIYSLYNKSNNETILLSKDHSKLSTSRGNDIVFMEDVVYNLGYAGDIKDKTKVEKVDDITVISTKYKTVGHSYDKVTIMYRKGNIDDMSVELQYGIPEFTIVNFLKVLFLICMILILILHPVIIPVICINYINHKYKKEG